MVNSKFSITVRLLEDASLDLDITEGASGKWLFEEVCKNQGVLEEREYFGLRFLEQERSSLPTKQWLDLTRGIQSQLKNTHPKIVSFRFKHYPSDPLADLRLAKTHYLLYQQLRRDLLSGRLIAPVDEMVKLGALIMQVELGDYSMQDAPLFSAQGVLQHSCLAEFRVLHNQTHRMESLMLEEHKMLEGLLPSEAADKLIQLANSLETYGIDPIRVKTKAYGSRPIHLGLSHRGVAEFVGNRCQKVHFWSLISWMTCDGKNFVVTSTTKGASDKKKTTMRSVQYKCENKAVARALWEWASDRRLFLTLEKSATAKPVKAKAKLFSRTLTYRFSGRCRREVLSRPSLAASTLPANLGANHTTDFGDESSGAGQLNPHSVSMVALSNASGTPELSPLRAIGEHEEEAPSVFPDKARSTTMPPGDISMHSLAPLMTSMELTVSEPPPAGISPISYASCFAAEEAASGNTRRVTQDQLLPLFTSLPRRRYASGAMKRQARLLKGLEQGADLHSDIFDHEDERQDAEAAMAALQSATDEAQAWVDSQQDVVSEVDSKSDSVFNSCLSFLRSSSPKRAPLHFPSANDPTSTTAAPTELPESPEAPRTPSAEGTTVAVSYSRWRIAAVSVGVLSVASLLGMGFLMESEVYTPVTAAIRGHPWLLDLDARYYRPVRAALFSLWRR